MLVKRGKREKSRRFYGSWRMTDLGKTGNKTHEKKGDIPTHGKKKALPLPREKGGLKNRNDRSPRKRFTKVRRKGGGTERDKMRRKVSEWGGKERSNLERQKDEAIVLKQGVARGGVLK